MEMQTPRLAFVGGGNMAQAIIGGLLNAGYDADRIRVADPSQKTQTHLQTTFGVTTTASNVEAIAEADVIVLAVKPQILTTVAADLRAALANQQSLLLSIAAGAPLSHLSQLFGANSSMVRAMPNTPALIGYGATGLLANDQTSEWQRAQAEKILSTVGLCLWLETEAQLDVVTALSGSGPAYFFQFMESLQQAAIDLGLPEPVANRLTVQTALGAAMLADQSGSSLATLRRNVTSPGGTTAAGLNAMQQAGIKQVCEQTLTAAKQRAKTLAQELATGASQP